MSIQRIHSGWNQKGKKRQIGQIASAIAVSIWKISKKTLLNLENEGFDTETWADRIEILKEVSCFQIYVTHNETKNYDTEKKINFITDIAKKLNETVNVNQKDLNIPSELIKTKFINLLNDRMGEYMELEYQEEPSYKARIILGNHLMSHMGEIDNNWIRMYVVDQEVPKILFSLRRPIKSLVNK
jgi:hypothetical protein|tara:strand:- start:254 stop:808 length:555 start_codon:yes stop_codon:yes gene_type:complete